MNYVFKSDCNLVFPAENNCNVIENFEGVVVIKLMSCNWPNSDLNIYINLTIIFQEISSYLLKV